MLSQTENIQEHRLVNRLRSYWDRLRETDDLPNILKFNKGNISDIWENCLLIKLVSDGTNKVYNVEYTGRELLSAVGSDLKGKYFSAAGSNDLFSRELISALNNSIEKKEFTLSEGTFPNNKGKIVKYRDCIMPFKDGKGEISVLVVGISWRAF